MALSLTNNLSEWDDCNTDNWTGDPTVGQDTDFQRYSTACIGIDVDIETHHMFGASQTSTDLSSNFIYMWFLSFSAPTLDIKSAGGMQICVEDSSGNQSCWYVGGSDNYVGGWELFSCGTAQTPDWNNGTVATLTDIVKIGAGFKNTAKSKLPQNCFVDWVRYGTGPAITITGSNTTAGSGWSEAASLDDTNAYGIFYPIPGGFLLKGPIQCGDSASTGTTDFSDYVSTSLVFDDLPVGDSHFGITVAGNATGTTDAQLGSVVGSGDSRQGVAGSNISSLGPAWEWDSATDITDLDSVYLYGCAFSKAHAGVSLDDDTKTSVISCTFTNCGEIDPGSTNDGAEILNTFIIDPEGTTNNYGLLFPQTPSAGTLYHNCKNINFITSGTPTTQYMTRFTYTGDYSIGWEGFQFFGDFSSSTLWHGLNSGTNADIALNVTGIGNATQSEFSSTNGGTVTVSNTKTLSVTAVDQDENAIEGARVRIEELDGTLISAGTTNSSGQYTDTSYNYSGDVNVRTKIRLKGYRFYRSSGKITNNGLTVGATLNRNSIVYMP
jgi:hypothetical protein